MQEYMLLLIILIPAIGAFFALTSKEDNNYLSINVYNIAKWTLFVNIIAILYIFSF